MLNRLLILALIGGLLPLGARWWWGLELLSHFRLQYLAIAAVLLVAAILARRRWLAMALATATVINAWPLLPYLPTATTPPGDETLTVLNLNANASNRDHARVIATMLDSGADIVTLIEVSPALEAQLAALETAYPFREIRSANDNFGLAVLSRYPLLDPRVFELGQTAAIETGIELPGRQLTLFAVHPLPPLGSAMAAERNRQLDQLAALAREAEEPLIVCGDFNLSPYSPYFAEFESASGTRDVRRGLGPGISWPGYLPLLGIPIDHCFTRGPLTAVSVERMTATGSDHYPVRVALRWRSSQ